MIPIVSVSIDDDIQKAVTRVLKSGQLAEGPVVKNFERLFSDFIGTQHAVAVNSGTAALHVALLASGVGPADEVITTPFSFIASANCCLYCGAIPVFADIDIRTFNISPEAIEEKISSKTKAVIVTHLYGQPCNMDEIMAICKKHDLILIEDACQAHGAEYKGHKAGSFGIGCFSFYATKNMLTGEGGMITTNDDSIAEKAAAIRNHGRCGQYLHDMLGYNFRMTDIAAAIGIGQLHHLVDRNSKRNNNATYLTERLSQINGLIPPYTASDRTHVFHQYTIRVTEEFGLSRDELKDYLTNNEIGSSVIYPVPIYKQPYYKELGYTDSLPISEKAADEVLSIPVHPDLTNEDLQIIFQGLENAK
ncbi:MAG: DegT/DnrJ/EryC1/StrS family aminotransferase [Dehalococcoidales bacterium]|nr:DegT/DnrJ/EryC1/StrS family aminotransferase [Dehalococcoidales bacterium]